MSRDAALAGAGFGPVAALEGAVKIAFTTVATPGPLLDIADEIEDLHHASALRVRPRGLTLIQGLHVLRGRRAGCRRLGRCGKELIEGLDFGVSRGAGPAVQQSLRIDSP